MFKTLLIKKQAWFLLLCCLWGVLGWSQSATQGNTFVFGAAEKAVHTGNHSFLNGGTGTQPGIIGTERTGPNGYLSFVGTSTWSGATNATHVDGYVKTYQTGAFTFPIGDNGMYRPAAVSAATALAPANAAYFGVNPSTAITSSLKGGNEPILPSGGPFSSLNMAVGVTKVSTNEYWDINGTTAAKITLTWNAASDITTLTTSNLLGLTIAGWDGTQWVNIPSTIDATALLGGSSTLADGSITTDAALVPDTYSVYTLANTCIFEVTCPTFAVTTVACYANIPTATTLTEAQFEALGNADGLIGDFPCGIIEITASNAVDPGCEGNVIRTYVVTEYEDTNGNGVRDTGENTVLNTQSCTQTYTIEREDFTMPANASSTVACAADIVAPTVPAVTDNCGNTLTASAPIVSTMPTCEGDVTYTYTFTDCEGNTHDWVYTYTIDDTIAPTGTAPADLVFQCIGDIPLADSNLITDEADNCGGAVVVTVIDTNNGGTGFLGAPYIVTRTYTLTDCSGLTTNLVQTITVEDTIAPVITNCPTNITVNDTATPCNSIATWVAPTVADNCSTNITVTSNYASGSVFPDGVTTVTYTVTDEAGNTSTCSFTVTVLADCDGDGVSNADEAIDGTNPSDFCDSDASHVTLPQSTAFLTGDCDGDGLTNTTEIGSDPTNPTDTDNDGTPDYLDPDDDGDGVSTVDEDINNDGDSANDDSDNDGTPDYLDPDDDGDGVSTVDEDINNDGDPTNDDSDNDGTPDYLDPDDDGDGVSTVDEDI
ncbi:MAG: HYR domain-containing protein, partial [Flavobacterium sp.]|uniref:HYR-like domain-containing protein n=1 Tax=Flavobacterium sp. TaxID=239 RepID=UPI00379B1DBB